MTRAGGSGTSYPRMPGPAAGPVPPALWAGPTAPLGGQDMISVRCANVPACGKTFQVNTGGSVTMTFSEKHAGGKPVTMHIPCPHCGKRTTITIPSGGKP